MDQSSLILRINHQPFRPPDVTPWGQPVSSHSPGPGLHFLITATSSGFWLEPWRQREFHERFPLFDTWEESESGRGGEFFESDCDACAVVLCWPEAFSMAELRQAVQVADELAGTQTAYLRGWGSIVQWLDLEPEGQALRARIAAWERSICEPNPAA
ncbi:MAG: DUF7007 domain-containing protein [Gemmataceae bacterium]